jgi:hypothetical protein
MNKTALLGRLLAVAFLGLSQPLLAAAPGAPPDLDHDGISDALEQRLAEQFAPLIYIEPDESNYPVNVDWFLDKAQLQYHEDCTLDVEYDVGPYPVGSELMGPDSAHYWAGGPNCGTDDTGYSHPPHRRLVTVAKDPDGQFSLGAKTTGFSDQQTFALADLAEWYQMGSTNPLDWVTYFHAYPTADGGIMLQYWHVFAYNQFGGGGDNHGGDWDASIQVQLDKNLAIEGVWFSRHLDDHPGTFFPKKDNQVRFFQNTHPVVTIDGGGHAAFRSPLDWETCNCRKFSSVTGQLGTVVWSSNSAAFDDPTALRKVELGCFLDVNGQLSCGPHLGSDAGGIVWKTWTGGGVVAAGSLTIPIVSPSGHGGLINLGEYNPCTPTSCNGSRQASTLLAGQFYPLNNNWWLPYEGRWGSVGNFNSGPRGPVFQGFQENTTTYSVNGGPPVSEPSTSVYTAWYNQGANTPAANDGSHNWLIPPTTTAAVGGGSYLLPDATYVTRSSIVTLGSTQTALAASYGPLTTYYRVYRSGGVPGAFLPYPGPFQPHLPFSRVPLLDGYFVVEYYSIDGLGNVEAANVLTLAMDNAAPVITINRPIAGQYSHDATLVLDYAVSDGAGVGRLSVVATMDGATALPDGRSLQGVPKAINLLTEMSLGSHTFHVTAADGLSNTSSYNFTFSIVATPTGIKSDVSQFLAAGAITSGPLANDLLKQLDAAAQARASGQCAAANASYSRFIGELRGQIGTGVGASAAAIMVADAQYLIGHCP